MSRVVVEYYRSWTTAYSAFVADEAKSMPEPAPASRLGMNETGYDRTALLTLRTRMVHGAVEGRHLGPRSAMPRPIAIIPE